MTVEEMSELIEIHDALSVKLNELVESELNGGNLLDELIEYRSADSSNFMKLLTLASPKIVSSEKKDN